MTAPLNLIGPAVRKFRNQKNWTQEALAARLQVEGWDVSRESVAKLEAQFRRAPDCELLFLAKVFGVEVIELFPAKLDLKKLDPALRLKVSTKYPRRKKPRTRGNVNWRHPSRTALSTLKEHLNSFSKRRSTLISNLELQSGAQWPCTPLPVRCRMTTNSKAMPTA